MEDSLINSSYHKFSVNESALEYSHNNSGFRRRTERGPKSEGAYAPVERSSTTHAKNDSGGMLTGPGSKIGFHTSGGLSLSSVIDNPPPEPTSDQIKNLAGLDKKVKPNFLKVKLTQNMFRNHPHPNGSELEGRDSDKTRGVGTLPLEGEPADKKLSSNNSVTKVGAGTQSEREASNDSKLEKYLQKLKTKQQGAQKHQQVQSSALLRTKLTDFGKAPLPHNGATETFKNDAKTKIQDIFNKSKVLGMAFHGGSVKDMLMLGHQTKPLGRKRNRDHSLSNVSNGGNSKSGSVVIKPGVVAGPPRVAPLRIASLGQRDRSAKFAAAPCSDRVPSSTSGLFNNCSYTRSQSKQREEAGGAPRFDTHRAYTNKSNRFIDGDDQSRDEPKSFKGSNFEQLRRIGGLKSERLHHHQSDSKFPSPQTLIFGSHRMRLHAGSCFNPDRGTAGESSASGYMSSGSKLERTVSKFNMDKLKAPTVSKFEFKHDKPAAIGRAKPPSRPGLLDPESEHKSRSKLVEKILGSSRK